MNKTENTFNKIFGTFLFLGLIGTLLMGALFVTTDQGNPPVAMKDSIVIPSDIEIDCVHCGWKNKVSLFKLPYNDTLRTDSLYRRK